MTARPAQGAQRILITGGAGFIGVNLVARLVEDDRWAITILDNESLGDRRSLNAYDVRFVCADICDDSALESVVEGQDVVVHLAADTRVVDSIANPLHNFKANVAGTISLLEACRRHGVKRVVAASTGGAILGEAPSPIREDMVASPLSPYGASKLAMEGYLSAYASSYGLGTCALRFSNIYGPLSFHKGSAVAHFFKNLLSGRELTIYGDGSQARDFLYVGDLIEGIRLAIDSERTGVYQLASGQATTVNQLLEAIREVTGIDRLPIRYASARAGEVHTAWCDISKARTALGFSPKTPLHGGLKATWEWFSENWGRHGAPGNM